MPAPKETDTFSKTQIVLSLFLWNLIAYKGYTILQRWIRKLGVSFYLDSVSYFLENLVRISKPEYVPTLQVLSLIFKSVFYVVFHEKTSFMRKSSSM